MPKFQVTKTVWGHGEKQATIVVEAENEEDAANAFWDEVTDQDWIVSVDHEDSDTEVEPLDD